MEPVETVTIKGEEVELPFTLGAFRKYQKYCKKNDLDPDTSLEDFDHLFQLLSFMSEYGNKKCVPDDFDWVHFSEITKVFDSIKSISGDSSAGNSSKKK